MDIKVQGLNIIVEGVKIAFDDQKAVNSFLLDYIANHATDMAAIEADLPLIVDEKLDELIAKYGAIEISYLNFTVRTFNCLKRAGIETVADILMLSVNEVSNIRNFGRRSIEETEQLVNELVRYPYIKWMAEREAQFGEQVV